MLRLALVFELVTDKRILIGGGYSNIDPLIILMIKHKFKE